MFALATVAECVLLDFFLIEWSWLVQLITFAFDGKGRALVALWSVGVTGAWAMFFCPRVVHHADAHPVHHA